MHCCGNTTSKKADTDEFINVVRMSSKVVENDGYERGSAYSRNISRHSFSMINDEKSATSDNTVTLIDSGSNNDLPRGSMMN